MANYGPPTLDFSWLGQAGDTLGKAFKERRDTNALLSVYDASQGQSLSALGQPMPAPAPVAASQAPGAPTGSLARLGDVFARTEAERGLPQGYLQRVASIESRGNPNAQNPNSSAGGLFQFIDSTAKQYGLANKNDPIASTEAAGRLAADNKAVLAQALGREPTAGELYLAHQQGAGGAAKLLANPNAPAERIVGAEAARLNGGAGLTAGEFAQKWIGKVDGGQPQVAQADLPAEGAAQAQGFAIPGGPAQPASRDNINPQMIRSLLANPGTRDIGKALWQQALTGKQFGFQVVGDQLYRTNPTTGQVEPVGVTNPKAALDMEKTRIDIEKGKRDLAGEGATPLTPEERKQYGIAPDQPAYRTRSDEIKFGPAGTKIINEGQKGETKFEEELGKDQAKRFNGYIAEGDAAQGRLADIQTLRETSRRLGSQGSSANLKATIGPYAESLGIKVEGLSDIQLYESITNRLAPTLRAPGSGSTSDIEFKGFQRAIGPLSNTPAAREMILDTFEAASRNDLARADIASRLAQKEITRGQAEREIRALPNPLEGFKKFREANPDLVGQAIKQSALRQAAEGRDPVKVASPDEARKLPSGTRIILPDGRQGQVP